MQGDNVKIAVIDGLGGGLGSQIINDLKEILKESVEIIALGTNSQATSRMIKEGAHRGATGENAVEFTVKNVDIILGPIGIIVPNSMSGEITPAIAEAVAGVSAEKYLIGIRQNHFKLIGLKDNSINTLIKNLMQELEEDLDQKYLKDE